ncbi:MAG: YggT family protein [Legionellaceae bacterium]|nr:YggT family protein [Legionellaceae bacterium]
MTNAIMAAGYFLYSLIFSILTFILWVRFSVRYFRISALHPVSQTIYRISDPIVLPIARLMRQPNVRKNRYDWPCFALLVLVEVIKFVLVGMLFFTTLLPWFLLILYPIADLMVQPLSLLFYAILIRVAMSWINPTWKNPFNDLLIVVTEPILSTVRRYIPYIAGFDVTPFVVLVVIKVITLFISAAMPLHLV